MLIIQRNKYHPGKRKQKVMSLSMSLSTGALTHWLPGFFEHYIGLQQLVIEFFKGLTIIRIIMTMIIAIIVIKH